MKNLLFLLAFGCLITHELDAMLNHEWRVLPLLRSLPDELGTTVFVAVHVPIVAVVVALVSSIRERTRVLSRCGVSAFLFLHGLAHFLSSGDPSYEFDSLLSDALIYGGALIGLAHLVASKKELAQLLVR